MVWERMLILVAIGIGGYLVFWLWHRHLQLKFETVAEQELPPNLLVKLSAGPNLLYFTGQYCAQCRLQQTPILTQLANQLSIPVHTIDAGEDEALAKFYGIMTVPTTIVLDDRWKPKAINHGLATLTQLRQQLNELQQNA